jgi:hypothetical protein
LPGFEKALHHVEHVGHVDLGEKITGRRLLPPKPDVLNVSYVV